MPKAPEKLDEFLSLVAVIEALRGPDGCPWDKEQTHRTLAQYAIEEAHEFAEAADSNDNAAITEELGDLLLQVVLNAEVARQEGRFHLRDVIRGINEKMIRRHPHVFGDVKVSDSREVLDRWSEQKSKEKKPSERTNPFSSIPAALPALQRACKIGAKTKAHRFDWHTPAEVLEKVKEETGELADAMANGTADEVVHEIGDLLFSVAQLARHLGVDPEQALRICNRRFETRFMAMQKLAEKEGVDFATLNESNLERLWQRVKQEG